MDIHVGLQAQTAAASTAITTGVCFQKIRKVLAFWFQEHERNTGKPVTMLWLFCFRDVILGLGIPWDTLGYLGLPWLRFGPSSSTAPELLQAKNSVIGGWSHGPESSGGTVTVRCQIALGSSEQCAWHLVVQPDFVSHYSSWQLCLGHPLCPNLSGGAQRRANLSCDISDISATSAGGMARSSRGSAAVVWCLRNFPSHHRKWISMWWSERCACRLSLFQEVLKHIETNPRFLVSTTMPKMAVKRGSWMYSVRGSWNIATDPTGILSSHYNRVSIFSPSIW